MAKPPLRQLKVSDVRFQRFFKIGYFCRQIILSIAKPPAMSNNENPTILIKLRKHFIEQDNIRSISRKGKNTVISLIKGQDIVVDIDYDKVIQLLPSKR